MLPEGFEARLLATAGEVVDGTGYTWHTFPDGGATFAHPDGGWVYVSNSELPNGAGGVGALRFDADGEVVDAYRICEGTSSNCAGGPTPWGTWLTGEEHGQGRVWECDPFGAEEAVVRPALGTFVHEAVAVDPDGKALYLTNDQSDGRFYRFTPAEWPSLEEGVLAVADVAGDGSVSWIDVPDPTAAEQPINAQVGGTVFAGGEGLWFQDGDVVFTTKGDNTVWRYTPASSRLEQVYRWEDLPEKPLKGVDNVTMSATGDIYVCEDGDDMELVVLGTDGSVAPFLRVEGQEGSELAGAAFSPDGRHLYLSSQRGGGGSGLTYEITGPFRQPPEPTTTTGAASGSGSATGSGGGDGDDSAVPVVVGGAAVLAAAGAGAAVALRRRRSR